MKPRPASSRHRTRPLRAPTLTLDIAGDERTWTSLDHRTATRAARRVASTIAAHVELPGPRVSATLLLSSDARVKSLNRQWRGIAKPTNVLSFPSPPLPTPTRRGAALYIGDVVLAEETLAREATELGIPLGDHYRHLVLHGLLHLLGYDHETEEEAQEMEALETRLLATLGVADPYAGSVPVPTRTARAPSRKRITLRK